MDKYKVAIVDDDEVALENLSFELGKDARFFFSLQFIGRPPLCARSGPRSDGCYSPCASARSHPDSRTP